MGRFALPPGQGIGVYQGSTAIPNPPMKVWTRGASSEHAGGTVASMRLQWGVRWCVLWLSPAERRRGQLRRRWTGRRRRERCGFRPCQTGRRGSSDNRTAHSLKQDQGHCMLTDTLLLLHLWILRYSYNITQLYACMSLESWSEIVRLAAPGSERGFFYPLHGHVLY